MNITVFYSSGRGSRSCTRGIARLLTDTLLEGGTLFEFQLPRDMPHVCTGCRACLAGHEDACGGAGYLAPILEAMARSELVVFCAPTYVFHMPGQLKSLLDHLAFRWMVHRPDLTFMHKQAVIINTAAGGGMAATVRGVRDSADYLGFARTHVISQRVWNYDWTNLPPSFRRAAEARVRKTADAVKRCGARLTPSLRVRGLLRLYGFLHKHRKMTPVDDDYWQEAGCLTGSSWQR